VDCKSGEFLKVILIGGLSLKFVELFLKIYLVKLI
jgi:hypothetical protein